MLEVHVAWTLRLPFAVASAVPFAIVSVVDGVLLCVSLVALAMVVTAVLGEVAVCLELLIMSDVVCT